MYNFENIRNKLVKIEYGKSNPSTYMVFIPVLSLIVQKIQMAHLLPLKNAQNQGSYSQQNSISLKLINVCKWHLRGSMVQTVACIVASKIYKLPIFSIIGILAMYEILDTGFKALTNKVSVYKLSPDGVLQGVEIINPFNIF